MKTTSPHLGCKNQDQETLYLCFRVIAFPIIFSLLVIPGTIFLITYTWLVTDRFRAYKHDDSVPDSSSNLSSSANSIDCDLVHEDSDDQDVAHIVNSGADNPVSPTTTISSDSSPFPGNDSAILVDSSSSSECISRQSWNGSNSDLAVVLSPFLETKVFGTDHNDLSKVVHAPLYAPQKPLITKSQFVQLHLHSNGMNSPWWTYGYAIMGILTIRAQRILYIVQDIFAPMDMSAVLVLNVTTIIKAMDQSVMIKNLESVSCPYVKMLGLVEINTDRKEEEAVLTFKLCPMGSVADRVRIQKLSPFEACVIMTVVVRSMARARLCGFAYLQFKLDYLLIDGMISNESELSFLDIMVGGHHALYQSDEPCTFQDLCELSLTCSEMVCLTNCFSQVSRLIDPNRILEFDFDAFPLMDTLYQFNMSLSWSHLLTSCMNMDMV